MVAADSSVAAAPMMDRRSQAIGPPIAAIRPTITINTPQAGPMAEIRPILKACLGSWGSRLHATVALLACRTYKIVCTADTTTVIPARAQKMGRLDIAK